MKSIITIRIETKKNKGTTVRYKSIKNLKKNRFSIRKVGIKKTISIVKGPINNYQIDNKNKCFFSYREIDLSKKSNCTRDSCPISFRDYQNDSVVVFLDETKMSV